MQERAEELAKADPMWKAVLVHLRRLDADLAGKERALYLTEVELEGAERESGELRRRVRSLTHDLRVDAASEWARGQQIVCDTLETAAGRLQAVL